MTTTYDITTTVGQIRLIIGDTDITDAVFTDEELTYFYTTMGSVGLAAASEGPPVRTGGVARSIVMPRANAGIDKVWVSVKNATNLDACDFFIGTHEYER